jgi:Bacterial transcriptional activator domain.
MTQWILKNVIKGQIFRLKKGLKEASIDEDTMTIDFVNGYYTLKTNGNVIVDSDIFEKLIDEANRNLTEDFNEAFILYNKAFKIYENQYLDNFGYELWLVPIRNYFRKLYVNAVENVVEQYKKSRMNDEIINICQKALSKEAYEEKLHQYLIESLLANGEIKQAVDHIKYLQNEFMKGTGIFTIDTINRLEDIFEKHQKENKNNESIGIEKLKYLEGAMKLDEEEFKVIYQVTKIRRKALNEGNYLLIVELDDFKKI